MPTVPELPDPRPLELTLRDRVVVTPLVTRLTLDGDDLLGFEFVPGQDLMLAIPVDDGTINRRYTIRRRRSDRRHRRPRLRRARSRSRRPLGHRRCRSGRPSPRSVLAARWCRRPASTGTCSSATSRAGPASAVMVESLPAASARWSWPTSRARRSSSRSMRSPTCTSRGATATAGRPAASEQVLAALDHLTLPDGRGHAYLSAELVGRARRRRVALGPGLRRPTTSRRRPTGARVAPTPPHGEPLRDA